MDADNIDDLIRQMQDDELRDDLEGAEVLTIGDYARMRGIRPQLVHSYLRRGKLERKRCACHRLVIDVKEANSLLDKEPEEKYQPQEECEICGTTTGEHTEEECFK